MNWKAGAGTEGGAKRKQSKKKAKQKRKQNKRKAVHREIQFGNEVWNMTYPCHVLSVIIKKKPKEPV